MDRMRVAVWGLGRHAIANLLPAVRQSAGLELYGVCSRDANKVAQSSEAWSCHGWTNPSPMLSDASVDIVYVSTPIGLHAEHGRAVLAAKKHFWCEKPLTSRLDDTLAILNTSRALGLSVQEGHMYLYHPQFERLSRLLDEERIGRILSLWCCFGIPSLERPTFRSDPSLGGGALYDVGSYPVSALAALFPDPWTLKYSWTLNRDGVPIDTDGSCVIEVADGIEATLEWRINCGYRNEIQVWGTKGSIFTDRIFSKAADYVPYFRIRDVHGTETIEYSESANHFVRMLEVFRATISDDAAAEKERNAITRRAEMLERIRAKGSAASGQSGGLSRG
jgi:predicted dehydrogenase